MTQGQLEAVREIVLLLPETTERFSHGAPAFFVRDKRPICYFHDADFARDGRVSIWCPAPPGAQEELVAADPGRYFAPTPSASGVFRDWVAAYLDGAAELAPDWYEIADIIGDAFRHVAPKRLVAELDQQA